MSIDYSRTIEQLQAFKPAYDKGLKRLRELQVSAGMPMADFFGELRDTALQGAEFGDLLQSDPAIAGGALGVELYEWYGPAALMELPALHERLRKTGH